MWSLSSINDESCFNLFCDSSSTVSRDGPGQIILKDKTVSKAHASFCLSFCDSHLSKPENIPEVILRDLKSSNGTYVCSESRSYKKLVPNTPVTVKQGDSIKFGSNKIFRLIYQPFIVTLSQITNKNTKEQLKECMKCLGGHIVKEWLPNCSLLIMNDLVLTTKTVCALAAGVNIVTPAYLIDMKTALKEKRTLPNFINYLPALKEPSIKSKDVSFCPNPSRKKLFQDKSFFFQNEISLKKMKLAVLEAGGKPVLLSENNYREVIKSSNIFIRVVTEKEEMPDYVSRCCDLLKKNELHPIPESDIGLAIVYNSTEKYCNPKFRMTGILLPNSNQSLLSSLKVEVYATETQNETESTPSSPLPSRTTIPESVRSSLRSNTGKSLKSNESQCKTVVEKSNIGEMNDENLGRRKRPFAESISPHEKVSESISKKANLSKGSGSGSGSGSEAIETMTVDDEVDNTLHFQPTDFSTEKLSPDIYRKRKSDDFAIPESTTVRKNIRIVTPQKLIAETCQDSPGTSRVSESIPFEPYTLPSINFANMEVEEPSIVAANEDEKETQIFDAVKNIKTEPVNQNNLQQIEESPSKVIVLDDDGWIKAPSKSPMKNCEQIKRVESTSDCFLKPNPVQVVKETLPNKENEFALSFSGRKRKGRLFCPSAEVNPQQPSVSKRAKIEQEPMSSAFEPLAARTIKKSPSVVEAEMNQESYPVVPRQEVEEIPFISTQKVKKEIKSENEVTQLTETMQRSFMIVQVVDDLIVKRNDPEESYAIEESNGLPNYKAFVKVWPNTGNETSLPHIIGGSDLVAAADLSLHRESFVASQPPLPDHLMRREQEAAEFRNELEGGGSGRVRGGEFNSRIGPNRSIDPDFMLTTRTGKRKGRL